MPVIIQFFKDMSPAKLAGAGLGLFFFIMLSVFYLSKMNSKDMSLLYSELGVEDSGKIIQELENKNVNYNVSNDGSLIKVPKDQVTKLRMTLAQAGIPSKGSVVGYEIFDKEDSIGTTNFAQNIKMVRALEGEIARTISSFDQVDKARVHLVLPQKEIFSKERLEPRVSVIIRFKNRATFNKSEVEALSHLIVTAVPGLDIKNLTIVDTAGHSLKLGVKDDGNEASAARGEEYRIAYENRLKKVIEDLLDQSLGFGKAKAQVAVEMNFDRTVVNTETYDPDGAVVRSVQTTDESESTPIGNGDNVDMSVANNIPGGMDASSTQNLAKREKSDQTTNYEISKTIKNQISESGIVTKLSIGVVVDGVYTLNPGTQKMDYAPRNKAELEQITNLVKMAVGFNVQRDDRIEVVNMQFVNAYDTFSTNDGTNWLKDELPNLFQTLVFAVVLVLVLVTVIRPITLKAFEIKRSDKDISGAGFITNASGMSNISMGGGALSDADGGAQFSGGNAELGKDFIKIDKSPKIELNTKRINELVVFYPQEMLNVLRKWLDEGK